MRVPPRWAAIGPLLGRGLRDNRFAPLSWGVSLGVFSAFILFTWPSIEDSVSELVESYPESLKKAFGIGELDSVEAYFDAEMLSLIVPLAISYLAIRIIARAVSTSEERGWLDTLLATPLARGSLIAGQILVAALVVAATLAATLALTLLAGVLSGTDPSAAIIGRGLASVWALALFFAGFAALVAGMVQGAGRVTAITVGALVGMYLLDVVGRIAEDVAFLRWGSAFRYYGSAVQDGIDPAAFAALTLAAFGLAAIGARLLAARDLG